MTAKKDFLGLVDTGREIRRAPLVGMHFLEIQFFTNMHGISLRLRCLQAASA